MKTFIYTFIFFAGSYAGFAQVFTNGESSSQLGNSNYFLDATTFEGFPVSTGKLLGLPRVDLTLFEFNTQIADEDVVLSYFDGAIVYNSGAGDTKLGEGIVVSVNPGYYYFSNPGNPGNVTSGRWIPIGSAANNVVKTREVIKTIDPGETSATVDLTEGDAGSQGMDGITVNEFLGAKIYKTVGGQLQMIATSSYEDGVEKILTTGNGLMYQVLPAGTYKFVIEYK